MSCFEIRLDDLQGPEVAALLDEHLRDMRTTSPPESKHALDLEGLRKPDVSFWTLWDDGVLAGCVALKALNDGWGEIKSMRTSRVHQRRGVAATLLRHLIEEARRRNYHRLSLETGSAAYFAPARALYRKFGFEECGPFASYGEDPNSTFMTLSLIPAHDQECGIR